MGKNKELPKEISEALQKSATDNHALLMSFIAPDKIVRTSPVNYDYASISVTDLYNVEHVIEELEDKNIEVPKKLHLVIHTPGGSLYIATKIAKFLRTYFDEIEAYVPYEAASGGTIMCLAANQIIMGRLANLTPIDPQKNYKGQQISTSTYQQTIDEFQERFGKQIPEEIEIPYQQMGKTFDPIILKEMNKIVLDTIGMAWGLLQKSQNPKDKKLVKKDDSLGIAWTLTTTVL